MKVRASLKGYWKPTPEKWRKIGDLLLIISTAINGTAFSLNYPIIGLIAQIAGVVGKVLTNFYHNDYNA